MNKQERKAYLKVKLRNLKREYSKKIEHADLMEDCIELKADIDATEKELKSYS